MAYTVGVLCRPPISVDVTTVLDDLVRHPDMTRNGRRREGDDWCASRGDYVVIDLTLSGDIDWPPILAFLRRVIEQHHGLLYDEVAGFKATLS